MVLIKDRIPSKALVVSIVLTKGFRDSEEKLKAYISKEKASVFVFKDKKSIEIFRALFFGS